MGKITVGSAYRIGGEEDDRMYVGIHNGNHEFIGPVDSTDPEYLRNLPTTACLIPEEADILLSEGKVIPSEIKTLIFYDVGTENHSRVMSRLEKFLEQGKK